MSTVQKREYMREDIAELIKTSLNENDRLNCATAFKISAKTKSQISEVAKVANELNIRIDNCDLGQFGSLDTQTGEVEVLNKLKPYIDDQSRIFCKDARACASGVSLKKIRSTLKDFKIDVKYCELGCFKEKKGKSMKIKTKIWIENHKGELLFGKGKTEVLDVIEQTGSIKKAAEILGMNYKKCWNHLKILETNFKDELFETKQGGGEDAGTKLKPKAFDLIRNYRQLEKDIEDFANKRFKELFLKKDQ